MEIDDFNKRPIIKGLPRQPQNYVCLNCSNGFDEPVVQNKILKIIAFLLLLFFIPFSFGITLFFAIIFYICAFKKTCPHCKSTNIKKDRLH